MSGQIGHTQAFNPDFDDTEWTDGWLSIPIALVPPGVHPSGYRVERHFLEYTEVFGHMMKSVSPFECRLLLDPESRLWMSDTPQERIMMYNNGRRSRGSVLVGGLGLGLYLQYAAVGAAGQATRFTVIEHSPVVVDIVSPTLSTSLDVPLEVRTGDVLAHLSDSVVEYYDTIFLDTWDTLDAAHLPRINHLRDLALRHLAPGGQVLLWGYAWMVRLFEQACRQLLDVANPQRRVWLAARAEASPHSADLLGPVMDRFDHRVVPDMEEAMLWCRRYITRLVAEE